jgi:integrase
MPDFLTDKFLKSLQAEPAGKRRKKMDARIAGFGVTVTPGRVLSFFYAGRIKGLPGSITITIGRYPETSLAAARGTAEELRSAMRRGEDPRQRQDVPAVNDEGKDRPPVRFDDLAERFIRDHVRRLRQAAKVEARVRRDLVSRWADRDFGGIRRSEVAAMVTEIKNSSGPAAARATLAYAKVIFSWAIENDWLEISPAAAVRATRLLGPAPERERVLTDPEIALIWAAAGDVYPVGPYVRMLILTGQRRREIAGMRWSELDLADRLLTIRADRMKGGAAHTVPLSPAAMAILGAVPRFEGSDYVFTINGRRPLSTFGPLKDALDAAATELNGGPLPHWILHDLRRTVRTGLSTLRLPTKICELVLAHAQPKLHRIYDLHRYDDAKRDALERWADKVAEIVGPTGSPNVIKIRA